MGKTTILTEKEVHIARQIMAITPVFVDTVFLQRFIECQVDGLKSKAKSMIPGIERDNVLKLAFPLPPLAEQKRIGHRDAPEDTYAKLREAVADHITEHGDTDFVVGHYGRFDSMAARAVREEKVRYPEVTLTLLLPYYPYTYDTDKYDGSFYPPGMEAVPKPYAIVRANQYMLRHSEYLICYCRSYPGNTRALVETALRRQAAGLLSVAFIEE